MFNSFNFTNQRIRALINDSGKKQLYKDLGKKGLILLVTPTGKKSFRLKAWNRTLKRTEEIVLGPFPDIGVNDARQMVEKMMRDMTMGVDLIEARKEAARAEMTVHDAFELWIESVKEKNKRWSQDQRRYELYIMPHFGEKSVTEVTPEMLIKWRSKLLQQKKQRGTGTLTKGTVQRAVIVFSSIYSSAARHVKNPCSELEHFKPQKRLVFMKSEQLSHFFTAVESHETPDYLRDFVLLSLYTGARRSNMESMRWDHIDLNMKLWVIPGDETKNDEPHVVPLLDQVVEILERRKLSSKDSEYVFKSPRKSKTGHLSEPKKGWKNLLNRAGLPEGFRMHDLRRTMGSWQAITGTSTKIIGASLGHKSEQATAHYAHLTIDPVRAAMQRAADAMDQRKGK